MRNKHKNKRKKAMPPTVWQALNEPVIEVSQEQGRKVMFAAVVILFAAWVMPYVGTTDGGMVAGATINYEQGQVALQPTAVPEWYYVAAEVPTAVLDSFAAGAVQTLDISSPVSELARFYEPGTNAVWNEWLNLMRDPGTPGF